MAWDVTAIIGICLQRIVGFDAPGRFPSVHHRHAQIHQDEIGSFLFRFHDALGAIHGLQNIIVVFEQLHEQIAVPVGIVDHQYFLE